MSPTQQLIDVAAGRRPADLVLKRANVVNVFTGEIHTADVAVAGGLIAGVGSYAGHVEVDCTDRYLAPGFIDAHVHIESSMVLPGELARMALPSGTTTLIADPHEIVNVLGAAGVQLMLDASEHIPMNVFVMLPSSVPATAFETAGATFTAADMAALVSHPRVLGLGEVMCFPDVLAGREVILEKLALLRGMPVDGHAPGLTGQALQAYIAAGVMTDHECTSFAEAAEKVRAGMAVLVREGSAAHNLATIVNGIVDTDMPTGRFAFCTDDKHLDDIGRDGHIRQNVKMAVALGMKPVAAIRMATYNAARIYGLSGVGAIAPGYKADLVLLSSLKQVTVDAVYKDGVPAEERLAAMAPFAAIDPAILHSVHTRRFTPADFALPVQGDADVIEMVPYQLETRHLREPVPSNGGYFTPDATYTKLCVIERHGKNGNMAVAPLKGYGIVGGAIATTVAHDSHNIIAAGDDDRSIALAVQRLAEIGGGYVLVAHGEVAGELPLAVGGIMSTERASAVEQKTRALLEQARGMGIPYYIDPFISLSFLALPVIPEVRLTDLGLFDVTRFVLIERGGQL